MGRAPTEHDPRTALAVLARDRGESLSSLSGMLGRNHAYLGQYLRVGSPRVLPERERRRLADHFGVAETLLGAPYAEEMVRLPRLDVAASAGPGATVDAEVELGAATIPASMARRLGLRDGSIIRARGSSMEPGLHDGDLLVVDAGQRVPTAGGGVYVIRIDGVVLVKRVSRTAAGLVARSDNPAAPPLPAGPVEVIGRVVWQMREPR
jgi:phage repressor protein C with HTH and peptisase S24 domain